MENCYYAEEPIFGYLDNQYQTAATFCNDSSSFQASWPHHVSNSTPFQFCEGFPSSLSSTAERLAEEDKAASASKSHCQAEKRRRDRINVQLTALRKLIPHSDKMDKAALLGRVIEELRDLKQRADEVSKAFMVPSELDDVTVGQCDILAHQSTTTSSASNIKNKGNSSIMIRVSVCCDDQPELFRELIQVLKRLKLIATKADIVSAGGRIKSILVLCSNDNKDTALCISGLKQALEMVLSKIAVSSAMPNYRSRSKRQRFFFPFQYPN